MKKRARTKRESWIFSQDMEVKIHRFRVRLIEVQKSGINFFDPMTHGRQVVLERWYETMWSPLLKKLLRHRGWLWMLDEIHEVILSPNHWLWHHRKGIVEWTFSCQQNLKKFENRPIKARSFQGFGRSKFSPKCEKRYTVADMITG